jgi:hypothetical protein
MGDPALSFMQKMLPGFAEADIMRENVAEDF